MTNPVDEHFKQDLENIEIKPSKDLWAEKIAPRVEGKKERKPVLWYRAAAVLVILLSGWLAIDQLQPIQQNVQELEIRTPVVLDKIDHQMRDLTPTILEPVQNLDVELQHQPKDQVLADHSAQTNEPAITPTPAKDEVVLAQVEPQAMDQQPTAKKKTIKVSLSLNRTSQTLAYASEPKEERSAVQDYARTQWENMKDGEKLEAPKEKLINWPKIKLEGNPLKGMFAAKGD